MLVPVMPVDSVLCIIQMLKTEFNSANKLTQHLLILRLYKFAGDSADISDLNFKNYKIIKIFFF